MSFLDFSPDLEQREELLFRAPHLQYALDVVDGAFPASSMCRGACHRALYEHSNCDWLYDGRWTFDYEGGSGPVVFASQIPHVRGEFARKGKTFILPPWQEFSIVEVYGWRSSDDNYVRRFQEWIFEVSKKNGKSSIDAILALYELRFGDAGAEVYSVATKADQAKKCWADALSMVERMPDYLAEGFEARGTEIIYKDEKTHNKFEYLSKASKSMDGYDPSKLIVDEAAAITDFDIVEKLSKSMGSRTNPLAIYSTHPQYSQHTVYYGKRESLRKALEGDLPLEAVEQIFGLAYGLDSEEEMADEDMWIKANPNLDVSVKSNFIRKQVRESELRPQERASVLTYHMGMWVKSQARWLDSKLWEACKGEVTRQGKCYVGVDLAETQDLTCVSRVWESGHTWFADFHFWTIQDYIDTLPEDLQITYRLAEASGILTVCDTPAIPLEGPIAYVEETNEEYGCWQVSVDPWKATRASNEWDDAGIPVLKVRQAMDKLSAGIDIVEAKIKGARLIHDGNPFLQWQFSNCALYKTDKETKSIRKPKTNPSSKIDGFASLFTCAVGTLEKKEPEKDFNMAIVTASGKVIDLNDMDAAGE